jgi:hypothetical protein
MATEALADRPAVAGSLLCIAVQFSMKTPKVKGLSKKEKEEHILDDFLETLPDFCASVLFNGEQRGDEWVCSDLQNSPGQAGSLGSCNINLTKGVFHDHNPAASPATGGMLDLWMAIFGVSKGDAIKGIKQWNLDRTLPDGSKGKATGNRVELQQGAIIEARDEVEEERIKGIQVWQGRKEYSLGLVLKVTSLVVTTMSPGQSATSFYDAG